MSEDKHDSESFRDSVTHIDAEGHRVWFYPKKPSGKLYQWRLWVSWIYLTIFFSLPFIKINGDPLFLFNISERKFILFSVRFWPQDFFIFMIGMVTFIVFIALFTVVFGRVFCGWVCPQTIFMEMVFRKIEYLIEGDSAYQKALNKMPWNREKIIKKSLKVITFFLVSVVIANTMLSYIIGVDELYKIITEPLTEHIGGFTLMIIFSAVFFFVYLWFREQACLVVCPYGRMQGVLLDKNSIVVAYDHVRGEPRSKPTKVSTSAKGDCIDCHECVRVCPTGIDIRNGTQLECVNCTACIDACDHIMESVHKPTGLIRYASENNIVNGKKLRINWRMVAYSVVLLLLVALESFLLITRSDLDVHMVRAKGTLFYNEPDGRISNLYNVKIINKTHNDLPLDFLLSDIPGEIRKVGNQELVVKKDSLLDTQLFIVLPAASIEEQKMKINIDVVSSGKTMGQEKTMFLGPHHQNK
jgi:cytochrome c oxidase accessory protein FixG